jgi:hypothetical protein
MIDDEGDINRSNFGVDLGDDIHELIEVNHSISILVGVLNDLVNLGRAEVFSNAGSDLLELLRAKCSGLRSIEGFEDGLKRGLAGILTAEAEDIEEGGEVNVARVAGVVDDRQDLACLSLKVERADGVDQFLSGDVSATVIIEHIEYLFQFMNRFFVQVLSHVLGGIETFGRGVGLGHLRYN